MVRLSLVLIALLLAPALAKAQGPCPPPDGAGKAIALAAPLDEATRLGLGYALIIAVANDDPNWPRTRFPADGGCVIGRLKVAEVEWTLRGGGGEYAPARWALPDSGDTLALLAYGPSIRDGYAFSQAAQKPQVMPLTAPMYVLAIERDHMRSITRVYDDAPPSGVLMADMAASLRGELRPIATLDAASGALSFDIATQSDRRAILPGLLPGEGGKAVHLTAPDGDFFARAAGGAVTMGHARFVCPASAAGFALRDLWIVDATETAEDLSCRFIGAGGSISVSVSRHAGNPPAKSVYDADVRAAQAHEDVKGAATTPTGAGAPPHPRFVTAWTDGEGRRQALWLGKTGQWYVEALATFSPQASDEVGRAVGQLYRDAFREISAK